MAFVSGGKIIAISKVKTDETITGDGALHPLRVVGGGKTYSGVAPVNVDNVNDKISVDLSEQATKTELSEISSLIINEIQERTNADIDIQEKIDSLEISSDVSYVVNSFSDLPTSATADEYAKVLNDSTHENKISYYQYKSGVWTYVGSIGPYYTKEEIDKKLMIETSSPLPRSHTAMKLMWSEKVVLTYIYLLTTLSRTLGTRLCQRSSTGPLLARNSTALLCIVHWMGLSLTGSHPTYCVRHNAQHPTQ